MKRSTDGVLSHKYHGFRCDQNGRFARALKNSQLAPGESHVIYGTGH
jgi:hypothetical protein